MKSTCLNSAGLTDCPALGFINWLWLLTLRFSLVMRLNLWKYKEDLCGFVCLFSFFFLFNSVPSVQCTRTKSYKKFPTCLVNCLKWFKLGQKILAGGILVHSDYSSYFVEVDELNCLEKRVLHILFTCSARLRFWTWNYNVHDLQLVTRWDNSQYDLLVKKICGVGIDHKRVAYLIVEAAWCSQLPEL